MWIFIRFKCWFLAGLEISSVATRPAAKGTKSKVGISEGSIAAKVLSECQGGGKAMPPEPGVTPAEKKRRYW